MALYFRSVGVKCFFTILFVLVTIQCFINYYFTRNLFFVDKENHTVPNQYHTCSNYFSKSDQFIMNHGSNQEIEHLDSMTRVGEPARRIDDLLLIRKLVLNSVQLLNKKSPSNPLCVKWWANPLTTWEISSTEVNSQESDWKLSFELEPGRVPVQVVIRQRLRDPTSINLQVQKEFMLISAKQSGFKSATNSDNTLECLCKMEQEQAEQMSMVARLEWNQTDRESTYWPPNSSFLFTDYVNFLDKDYFLKSPGKSGNRETSYCGPTARIILLIHSALDHFVHRAVIRKTYGNRSNLELHHARLVFFVGTVSNSTLQNLLDKEAEDFDDIAQANFVDSYHNNTLKHLSIFHWIYLQCTNTSQYIPQHILKADDDFILNVQAAVRMADENPKAALMCVTVSSATNRKSSVQYVIAVREWNHKKWYLPRYIYLAEPFHGYLSGGAYVMRGQLIPGLLQAALTTPLNHIDYVFVEGGILSREINVLPQDSSLFNIHKVMNNSCLSRMRIMSHEMENSDEMLSHWEIFSEPLPPNCSFSTVNFKSTLKNCPIR